MRVVAYDPFVAKERYRELGVERAETPEDVLRAAEFLTLHLPLTDETRGFLGVEAIAQLPDGARVINAARAEPAAEAPLSEPLPSANPPPAATTASPQKPTSGRF